MEHRKNKKNQCFSASRVGLATLVLLVTACGGGAATEPTPVVDPPDTSEYTGPAPATADVQSFRINVWDNLKATSRCGNCHSVEGGQSPMFVRQDDINLAYGEATNLVNLNTPADSTLIVRVANGHNCWLSNDAACAEIMTSWVSAWAGEALAGGGREIDLQPPPLNDPGDSKSFPDDPALFANTIHPLLLEYCANCHSSDAQFPQQPYFAELAADVAYEAARQKINLDEPAQSRFVLRLGNEFHNCWSNCPQNANVMLAAINAFADQITPTQVDPALITSKALSLIDGTVASGGNRYETNAIATYEFKARTGLVAFDTSGIEPSANLNLSGDVSWLSNFGIKLSNGKAQASTSGSKKLHDLIKATGEFSVEAWVVPANVTQEEARIVSYSAGVGIRNFALAQTLYNYDLAVRSDITNANGMPALSTADADEDLQATLQHVVTTYDPTNGGRIYVNGVFTDDVDLGGGSLADWDDSFALVLGNEASGDRPWAGSIRFVSIHNRVLTDQQIVQNFEAGVGEKFFLLFSVSHLIEVPEAYILFQVSQFDDFSYLFEQPQFISLDVNAQPNNIPLQGMRIGINGIELTSGQAFSNLEASLDQTSFIESRQDLSRLGTLIPVQKGSESDSFFLTFERLGQNTHAFTDSEALQPAPTTNVERPSAIGLRTFDEINATMATISTVNIGNDNIQQTYTAIRQQLPTVEAIEGFLASHQIAVAQLAIEYCNELVNDDSKRSTYFNDFDFNQSVVNAFAASQSRNQLIDPLIANMIGADLASQPDEVLVRQELNALIDRLSACGANCDNSRTETIAKAACAATLGSAAILIN